MDRDIQDTGLAIFSVVQGSLKSCSIIDALRCGPDTMSSRLLDARHLTQDRTHCRSCAAQQEAEESGHARHGGAAGEPEAQAARASGGEHAAVCGHQAGEAAAAGQGVRWGPQGRRAGLPEDQGSVSACSHMGFPHPAV